MFMKYFSFELSKFDWNMSVDEPVSPPTCMHTTINRWRASEVYDCFVPQNLLIGHSLVQSDSCNSVISHDLSAIKIIFWASSIKIRCGDFSLIEGILTHPIHPVYQTHQTPDSFNLISYSKSMNQG